MDLSFRRAGRDEAELDLELERDEEVEDWERERREDLKTRSPLSAP